MFVRSINVARWNEFGRRAIALKRIALLASLLGLPMVWPLAASAVPAHVDDLPEQVIMLRTQQNPAVFLETTIYKPDGPGPFPLVIMNHGSTGFPRQQQRDRPLSLARYFLERGYMVAAPMRQGFSKSTGNLEYHGCDVQAEALTHAEDIRAAMIALQTRPDVDAKHVLLIGQSYGGMATIAAGSLQLPEVQGTVVFSGVMGSTSCRNWPVSLIDAAGHFGKTSRTPSLWFYGSNDHYIPQPAARSMASAYDRAGGYVRLITYPDFKAEGHFLLYDPDGRSTWEKPLTDFLGQTGMPHEISHPEYSFLPLFSVPPASDFAALDDVTKLPAVVGEPGRQLYRDFLKAQGPRAFAISGDGATGTWWGDHDNLRRALSSCSTYTTQQCFLYAVDDTVVWNPANLPSAASEFWKMWRPLVAFLSIGFTLIIFILTRLARAQNALNDDMRLRAAARPASHLTVRWRISRTGIAFALLLVAIPAVLYLCDPVSYAGELIRHHLRRVLYLLLIVFGSANWLLGKLGLPLMQPEHPETAKELVAKAEKKGYRRS